MERKIVFLTFFLGLALFGCTKKENEIIEPKITNDNVEVTSTSASFTWTVDWVGKRISVVEVSEDVDMNDSQFYGSEEEINTSSFSTTANDLKPATKYYYRFWVWNQNYVNNRFVFEKKSFLTFSDVPKVKTVEVTNIARTSAICKGEIVSDGGEEIIERGVCWGLSVDPNIDGSHAISENNNTSFSVLIDGLDVEKLYYVRSYAINSHGVGYGDTLSFKTTGLPAVETMEEFTAQATSVVVAGFVVDNGGVPLSNRGICWGSTPNPTIADNHTEEGNQTGSFSSIITGLSINTTYYFRAYATNDFGTSYGQQIIAKTKDGIVKIFTNNISSIMATTATSGGIITDDGGFPITSRGICWSTSQNPSLNDDHTSDGSGDGSFTCSMEALTINTVYYVRAYAVNSNGTYYGDEKTFTTMNGVAVVSTKDVSNINKTTASCGGTISSDGGSPITAKGVCWSIYDNPSISDDHTSDGSGTSSFNSSITGLENGTYYYVRAYVTNAFGTYYGEPKKFVTRPIGAIGGVFSVGSNKKVFFSKGNLQYLASTNKWRFAEQQYDYIGSGNMQASQNYSSWIDVFNYGTSGYDDKVPWNPYNHASCCIENTYYDWGLYNAVNNGGNQNGQWRTLTKQEWQYLLNNRLNASLKRSLATVNQVPGYILLPDQWDCPNYNFIPNASNYVTNIYDLVQWSQMQEYGAVFFPAAGYKLYSSNSNQHMYDIGVSGWYFSTEFRCTTTAPAEFFSYFFKFNGSGFEIVEHVFAMVGGGNWNCSVRLVQDP